MQNLFCIHKLCMCSIDTLFYFCLKYQRLIFGEKGHIVMNSLIWRVLDHLSWHYLKILISLSRQSAIFNWDIKRSLTLAQKEVCKNKKLICLKLYNTFVGNLCHALPHSKPSWHSPLLWPDVIWRWKKVSIYDDLLISIWMLCHIYKMRKQTHTLQSVFLLTFLSFQCNHFF